MEFRSGESFNPSLDARSAGIALLFILLLGGAIRLFVLLHDHPQLVSDSKDYHELAVSIAAGNGYTLNGKPTAYRPPGYPLVLSLTYRVFGTDPVAGGFLQIILELVLCVLIFLLGKSLFSNAAGLLASGLWASNPVSIIQSHLLLSESLFGCLFAGILFVILSGAYRKTAGLVLFGILCGYGALTKPFFLLAPLFLTIWMIRANAPMRNILRTTIVAIAVMLCVVSPWVIRNAVVFHKPMISSNGGINFWIGNNESASGGYRFHPLENPFQGIEDEIACDSAGYRLGWNFLQGHPLHALSLLPRRLAYLFSSESPYLIVFSLGRDTGTRASFATLYMQTPLLVHLGMNIHYILFITLGTLGFFFMPGSRTRERFLIALCIGFWIVIHLAFFGNHRFHYPLMPLFVVGTAYAALHWRERPPERIRSRLGLYALTMICFAGILAAEVYTAISRATP